MELKSQLRIYKNKYPEMSYDDIYSKYLSNWEENRHENRQKKLYNLLYEISEEQEETESESTDSKKCNMKTAVAGSIVMVFGAVIVKIWMKKK